MYGTGKALGTESHHVDATLVDDGEFKADAGKALDTESHHADTTLANVDFTDKSENNSKETISEQKKYMYCTGAVACAMFWSLKHVKSKAEKPFVFEDAVKIMLKAVVFKWTYNNMSEEEEVESIMYI